MQDFIHVRIPVWLRRIVTMVPSFIVVGLGVDATRALIVSQVTLSLFLPVPMVAPIILSARQDVVGRFANTRPITTRMFAAAAAVVMLNAILIVQALGLRRL